MSIPMLLGPDRWADPGRLADRHLQLAVDIPDQPADRRSSRSILAAIVFPRDHPARSETFDVIGVLLLSPGLATFLFGVSSIPRRGTVADRHVLIPATIGLALIIGVRRCTRYTAPITRSSTCGCSRTA